MEVNIHEAKTHEAKTHFSRLLERVALGEEIIIAKAGTPVAKIVPLKKTLKKRVFGSAKGEFTVPEDFNDRILKLGTCSITDPFHRNEGHPRHARILVGACWG